ncbi:hypothetical protein [Chryseobacterium sp. HSC-36S06]|uniref:hypothetical protein n=1 Tax=Chryseobacterium sp. HSC-36S06 TaxID=2910970 RepID=UPI00209FB6E2|nr:hypothetical protein [Chryseobacterium sp. HSC-36S06]MCP2037707.1 O-antigen/teichoic acid export membrane protein [Chryseobacterium sp. HSC-36S06]
MMTVESFGYWQLFLFYSSFVGFFHLGLNDGIYLRYGGKNYSKINKSLLKGQFIMLATAQFLFASVFFLAYKATTADQPDRLFVIFYTMFFLVISNITSFVTLSLQSMNRLKDFSRVTLLTNVLLVLFFIILAVSGQRSYEPFVRVYLAAHGVAMVFCIYLIKDVINQPFFTNLIPSYINEIKKNVSVGSQLMFSTIASMLILGTGRFFIEKKWGIVEFGKISFILTLTTFFIFFIRQIGVVIFPLLRNKDNDEKKSIYHYTLGFLNTLLFGLLLFFPLLEWGIDFWLPKYSSHLSSMIIILPVLVFEGKMQVLLGTYMKVLRKERKLLIINVMGLLLSLAFSAIGVMMNSLMLLVVGMTLSIALRGYLVENYLSRHFQLKQLKQEIFGLLLPAVFILAFLTLGNLYAFGIYLIIYFIFLLIQRNDLGIFWNLISVTKQKL